ncbi:glycolipid sulfotransferase [Mycobacterium marinum E11]|nr:glycolipid sulfotransferase [Mycobacterium marinum E11]
MAAAQPRTQPAETMLSRRSVVPIASDEMGNNRPPPAPSSGQFRTDDRVAYRSWMSDNLRWDSLTLRDGDIVISAPPKCGTTWTQRLISLLIFDGPQLPAPMHLVSPWLDLTARPVQEVAAALDAQPHRRFIKTHTPLDGLVLEDRVTYIGVGRDPRDAAVSMLMDQHRMRALHEVLGPPGERFAPPGLDFDGEFSPLDVLRRWLEGPNVPTEGIASLATILHHFATFWDRRRQPNVAMFHYADYRADLVGELLRLGSVLGIELGPDRAAELAEHATLDAMRAHADALAPAATPGVLPGHQPRTEAPFFRAGGRGQWHDIFTAAEHRRYGERAAELAGNLGGPEFLDWAHRGRGDRRGPVERGES